MFFRQLWQAGFRGFKLMEKKNVATCCFPIHFYLVVELNQPPLKNMRGRQIEANFPKNPGKKSKIQYSSCHHPDLNLFLWGVPGIYPDWLGLLGRAFPATKNLRNQESLPPKLLGETSLKIPAFASKFLGFANVEWLDKITTCIPGQLVVSFNGEKIPWDRILRKITNERNKRLWGETVQKFGSTPRFFGIPFAA